MCRTAEHVLREIRDWRANEKIGSRILTAKWYMDEEEEECYRCQHNGLELSNWDKFYDRQDDWIALHEEKTDADDEAAEERDMLEEYRRGGLFHTWGQFQSRDPLYELVDEIPFMLRKRMKCVFDALRLVSLDALGVCWLPAFQPRAWKLADAWETTRTVVEELTPLKMLAFAMGAQRRLGANCEIVKVCDDAMKMISRLACEAPYVLYF